MSRFAIADIHGCYQTLRVLVEQRLRLNKNDTLFLLGDYINKGPDSKGVLDYLMHLKEAGYKLEMIRGNHDQMLIETERPAYKDRWEEDEDLLVTLKNFGVERPEHIPERYKAFLSTMPYYLLIEDYLLVHAGINFEASKPFEDYEAMLNIREFSADLDKIAWRKIVHGHTPTPLKEIQQSLKLQKDIINIDAGCSKSDDPDYGYLVALNLDTLELIAEPNRE